MRRHILACEGHFWCSNGHANGWVLVILAGIIAVALAAVGILALVSRPRNRR